MGGGTSAGQEDGAPDHAILAGGRAALFGGEVVDGGSRVAAAALIADEVGLVGCTHGDAGAIGEIVYLVATAVAHQRLAFEEIGVPDVAVGAVGDLAEAGGGVEVGLEGEAFAAVVVGVVFVADLALVDAFLEGEVVGLPGGTVAMDGGAFE